MFGLSVSGEHIRGINTQGAIAIDGNNSNGNESGKIDENDVRKVLEMAKAISFPTDREILHILPQEYVVDVMEKIKDPVGMSGRRLEARVHLGYCNIFSSNKFDQLCTRFRSNC